MDDIKVKMKIVKDSTTCKRGQEYCILLYSEKKDKFTVELFIPIVKIVENK